MNLVIQGVSCILIILEQLLRGQSNVLWQEELALVADKVGIRQDMLPANFESVVDQVRKSVCGKNYAPSLLTGLSVANQVGAGTPYMAQPLEQNIAFPGHASSGFEAVRESLLDRLKKLSRLDLQPEALQANLLGIAHELLWGVPSQKNPEIAVYDEIRLSVAVIAALANNPSQKMLLVGGDLGGIQGHIYRIRAAQTGSGGIAKRLRARSLEVSLATEAFALGILDSVEFTPAQRIVSAGGKFYLLLPNSDGVIEALRSAQQSWNQWSLEQGFSLIPYLAWVSFSFTELSNFQSVMNQLQAKQLEVKYQPLQGHDLQLPFHQQSLRPCTVCGVRPAKSASETICKECEGDAETGRRLPQTNKVGLGSRGTLQFPNMRASLGGTNEYTLRSKLEFEPSSEAWEVRPVLGYIPSLQKRLSSLDMSLTDYMSWAQDKGILDEDASEQALDRPLTFAEIAARDQGVAYIGILALDADRMGEAFLTGFKSLSLGRLGGLSRLLEHFFGFESNGLLNTPELYANRLGWNQEVQAWKLKNYPLVYSVFAGGDDIFWLGPWDVMIEIANDLNSLYHSYTQHPGMTLSGGLIFAQPSSPIHLLADEVRVAEQTAKDDGRNRLNLFGQSVVWSDLEELIRLKKQFALDLGNDTVSSSFAYKLLSLFDEYTRANSPSIAMAYKPKLAYALRDYQEPIRERYGVLFNHSNPAWRHLPVWVQAALLEQRR